MYYLWDSYEERNPKIKEQKLKRVNMKIQKKMKITEIYL